MYKWAPGILKQYEQKKDYYYIFSTLRKEYEDLIKFELTATLSCKNVTSDITKIRQ